MLLSSSPSLKIVLLGKVGHGKTYLLNKVCGRDFASTMCAASCTRKVHKCYTRHIDLMVIDTPGFCSSDNTYMHIQAQRSAIETYELSGIYLVVKYGAPGDMAECLNHLMDFVGTDDVRVIVSHIDIAYQQQHGLDADMLKNELSGLIEVNTRNIFLVGKDTSAPEIEDFLYSTLHEPKRFKLQPEQVAYAASLTVGARRFNNDIEAAASIVEAASLVCEILHSQLGRHVEFQGILPKTREATTLAVERMLKDIKEKSYVLRPEEQDALQRKVISCVTNKLSEFQRVTKSYRCAGNVSGVPQQENTLSHRNQLSKVSQNSTVPVDNRATQDHMHRCTVHMSSQLSDGVVARNAREANTSLSLEHSIYAHTNNYARCQPYSRVAMTSESSDTKLETCVGQQKQCQPLFGVTMISDGSTANFGADVDKQHRGHHSSERVPNSSKEDAPMNLVPNRSEMHRSNIYESGHHWSSNATPPKASDACQFDTFNYYAKQSHTHESLDASSLSTAHPITTTHHPTNSSQRVE